MEDRMRTRGAVVMGSNIRTHAPTIVFEYRVKGHVSSRGPEGCNQCYLGQVSLLELIHLASYSC